MIFCNPSVNGKLPGDIVDVVHPVAIGDGLLAIKISIKILRC